MTIPFVNIHTHHPGKPGTLSVVNLILESSDIPLPTPKVWFSCGIHPWYLDKLPGIDVARKILETVVQHERCLALGEAGLDKSIDTDLSLQQDYFAMQVKLAEQLEKPLIIHCVKAYSELLAIRKSLKARQPWIFHGFSSSVDMAHRLLESGCMLSFGKAVFNEKSKARNAIAMLQPGEFFLETDDEDFSIRELYTFAAGLKNISPEHLRLSIWKKFCSVFNIDEPHNL